MHMHQDNGHTMDTVNVPIKILIFNNSFKGRGKTDIIIYYGGLS